MDKIQFDINKRPEIEAGKYKVVTRDGRDVRILCWDANQFYPICAQFRLCAGTLIARYFDCNGIFEGSDETENGYDLFLITTEPELSEFEEAVGAEIFDPPFNEEQIKVIKEESAKLLELAKKELCESGEVTDWYSKGKAEALKDLPRWKKCEDGNTDRLELEALGREAGSPFEIAFRANGYRIFLSDLVKLPKEDEK